MDENRAWVSLHFFMIKAVLSWFKLAIHSLVCAHAWARLIELAHHFFAFLHFSNL